MKKPIFVLLAFTLAVFGDPPSAVAQNAAGKAAAPPRVPVNDGSGDTIGVKGSSILSRFARNGRMIWEATVPKGIRRHTMEGENVLVLNGANETLAYQARTGKLVAKRAPQPQNPAPARTPPPPARTAPVPSARAAQPRQVQPGGPVLAPSFGGGQFQPGGVLPGFPQPGMARQTQPSGPVLAPSFRGGQFQPGGPLPGFPQLGQSPTAPPPSEPAAPPPESDAPRFIFRLTNGSEEEMTVLLKFVNTDGEVRWLKADRARTLAPGEKCEIVIQADIATVRERAETKYLVALQAKRDGRPDLWWGVKGEGGQVQDKNEITGIRFQSFSKGTGGKTKTLSKTLRATE